MCRLLYLPADVRPTRKRLRRWLARLVKSNGGDGCGLAGIKHGEVKGTGLTATASEAAISKRSGEAMVWHTRRISCGARVDELCHPFSTGRAHGWLVHNGHWDKAAFAAKVLAGNYSDTRVAALWISLYGWESFTKQCDRGVWLHLTAAGLAVHYASGELWVEEETGALASEPCPGWGVWREAEHGTYAPGEPIPARRARFIEVRDRWAAPPSRQGETGTLFQAWHP